MRMLVTYHTFSLSLLEWGKNTLGRRLDLISICNFQVAATCIEQHNNKLQFELACLLNWEPLALDTIS